MTFEILVSAGLATNGIFRKNTSNNNDNNDDRKVIYCTFLQLLHNVKQISYCNNQITRKINKTVTKLKRFGKMVQVRLQLQFWYNN